MSADVKGLVLVVVLAFVLLMTALVAAIAGGQFNWHPPTCVYSAERHDYVCESRG